MKKRQLLTLGIITAIMAMLFMFSITSHAIIGMGSISGTDIAWVIEDDGTLTVSGSGQIPDYTDATSIPWSAYSNQIKKLEVTGTITKIGAKAFANLSALTEASICDSVTTIGDNAFGADFYLKTLKLPASLKSIGEAVFRNNFRLTTVTLEDSNTYFDISDGVMTSVDGKIIYWAGGISSSAYYVSRTVEEIKEFAFGPCASKGVLKEIYVSDTVNTIGINAFYNIESLYGVAGSALATYATENSITLAGTYDGMCGPTAFYDVSTKKGSTISTTKTALLINGIGSIDNYYTTSLPPWNSKLTAIDIVVINSGITNIGSMSFYGATSLASVTLPSSVTSIGASAFEGCTLLTEITLPATLKTINQRAFANTALTTIVIPTTVTSLNLTAFSGCESLGGIIIPSANTVYASVNGVVFSKNKTQLMIYPGGKTDETYTIPSGVTHIYAGFEGNSSLKYVYIPESVTNIFSGVFSSCDGLTVYGYTGTAAETYASNNSITFVPMDGTIEETDIEWYYDYTTQTLTVSGTGTVPAVAAGELWMVFADTTKIISIEEGITDLRPNSFPLHNALETVYFPTTLTDIRSFAFYSASEPDITVIYAGSPDEWDDVFVGFNNQIIDNATVSCEQSVSIDGIATGTNVIFVSTTNIDDGRKIAVAAYSSDGRMISFNYVEITNNIGNLSVSTENVGYIKAFYINTSSLKPYCNALTEPVS